MNDFDKKKNFDILKEILKESIKIIKEIGVSFKGKEFTNTQQRTFNSLLHRNFLNFKAINKLLEEFELDVNMKFPISIILRNGILDYITISYLLQFHEDEKKFTEELAKLDVKSAKIIYKLIQNNDFNKQTDKVKNEWYSLFKEYFPDLWNESKKKINDKIDELNPPDLAVVFNIVPDLKNYCWAYDNKKFGIYQELSMYEHYCTMSNKLLQRDHDIDFECFVISIDLMLTGSVYICIFFQLIDYKNELEKIRYKFSGFK